MVDGDELRELLDGVTITKFGGGTLLTATGCSAINGTKSNPNLQADILGDWREELICKQVMKKSLGSIPQQILQIEGYTH